MHTCCFERSYICRQDTNGRIYFSRYDFFFKNLLLLIVIEQYEWTTAVEHSLHSLGKFIYLFVKYRYQLTTGCYWLVRAIYGRTFSCMQYMHVHHVFGISSMVSRSRAPFTKEIVAIRRCSTSQYLYFGLKRWYNPAFLDFLQTLNIFTAHLLSVMTAGVI